MTELNVCVFCGSRAGNDPAYTDAAHAMAHELASLSSVAAARA